jgi:hypothetical protein
VDLACADDEVDTAEDLLAFDGDMEVLDLEQRGAHDTNPITTTDVGEIAGGVFWCPLRIPLTSAL